MSVRRALSVAGLVASFTLLSALPALADTTGDNADRLSAAADWEDAPGNAHVGGFSDPAEGTFVEYGFFREFEVTCDDGSSALGSSSFFGQSAGSLTIDKKLATAIGSGAVTGNQDNFDPCTGESTSSEATFQVSFALRATTGASTFTSKSKETAPDGTKVTVTTSITTRQASGSVIVNGGAAISPDTGEIQHLIVTTRAK